jgi:hypothetical protein
MLSDIFGFPFLNQSYMSRQLVGFIMKGAAEKFKMELLGTLVDD